MKVAFDLTDLLPGQMGGVETYSIDLINELAKHHDVAAFTPHEYKKTYKDLSGQVNLHVFRTDLAAKLRRVSYRVAEAVCFQEPMRRYGPDIIHIPFQVVRHRFNIAPVVVSIMDIQHEYYPDYFAENELESRRSSYLESINSANHVIAISHFTKQTLVEKLDIDPRKITVVHLSHDANLFDSAKPISKTLSLPPRYFFYPAATWPHKNHIRLLEAFSQYKKQHRDKDVKFVFTGVKKQESDPILNSIHKLGLDDQVVWLGHIERELLPQVYKYALGLVYPSEFEGFGIPLLEAMAIGCPVAASDCTSIPEVGGNAVKYFKPNQVSEIVSALEALGSSSSERTRLIESGIERAKLFSPKKMAKETYKVYQKVLERKK